jgi:hypothetical protein
MKYTIAACLLALGSIAAPCSAQENPAPLSAKSVQEQLDYLVKQNQMLLEEVRAMKSQLERPQTPEEVFATCMQAAKGGTSAMAAESIGSHCDKLLRK